MKKSFVFSGETRACNLGLQLGVVISYVWLTLLASAALVEAKDGYAALAAQIVEQPPQGAVISRESEQAILMALNGFRASKGRPPLPPASAELQLAARAHALDLLAQGTVGHVSSTGYSFESRIRALKGSGLLALPSMAENAARDRRKGVPLAEKAHAILQQWIDSPRHRKSLTDRSFVAVATGVARKGDVIYAVQIFVGPETKNNLFGN